MNLRMRYYVLSLAAIGLLVGATNARPNSVSGEAFGISVNAAGVRGGPTPPVVLPPDGGMGRDQLLGIAVPNLAASTTLGVVTPGSIGPSTPTARNPVTGTITADIIVSSAHSDVNFIPAPKTGNAFMTGGGKLGTGRDIATFGFNAGSRGGVFHGELQYIDHAAGLKVHSLSIESFGLITGTPCVTFSGSARVNDADGYSFTVNRACDHGEPGVGQDTFDISVSGPGVSYSRSGTLTGGNLQLHPE